MARQAADNGPDSYPAVFGARPSTTRAETTPAPDELTNTDLSMPKLPPPKLAVFGPPSPGAPAPTSGTYRLGKVLGTGDLATVYEAFKDGADGFRKRVAIKRIHSHLAQDSKIVELLGDEARLSSLIQHPNVCQVLDFVDDGSASFIVMELLEGCTLLQALTALRKAPERAASPHHQWIVARIIAGLAEGLHAAHELEDDTGASLQVVHRDVTPHNLFVLKSGAVKVTDFGIARARNHVHETAAGVLRGRLAYTAPEKLQGLPVDRRTDIFSLGVVMWELLTAESLFERPTDARTLAALRHGNAPDPKTRQKAIAPSLSAIVLKALEPDPAARFESAREMSRALDRAIAKSGDAASNSDIADWMNELLTSSSAPRPAPAELPKPVTPPGRGLQLIVGVSALLLAGAGWFGWRALKQSHGSVARPVVAAAVPVAKAPATPVAPPPAAAAAVPAPQQAAPEPVVTSPTVSVKSARSKAPTPTASSEPAVAAPPASADPAVRSGFVMVAVNGAAAEILIEGRTYPANRTISLPIGPHRVTIVRKADHVGSREIEVNVREGATSFVPITLPEAAPAAP